MALEATARFLLFEQTRLQYLTLLDAGALHAWCWADDLVEGRVSWSGRLFPDWHAGIGPAGDFV